MEYRIIRSKRRTLAIEVTSEAELLIRAPLKTSENDIQKFLNDNQKWIDTHVERAKERVARHPEPDDETREKYIADAKVYIPERVKYFSNLMQVTPAGITITGARKRFGSCSGKNRLCFSWRVMEYSGELVDYVIVHELAHIKYHDHSREFYRFVEKFMPDYKEKQNRLKYE